MQTEKIPLTLVKLDDDNYHLFVSMNIGKNKLNMLVDTGASKTVFDKTRLLKVVKPEKIMAHHTESVGLGANMVKTEVVELSNIKFERLKIKTTVAAVIDLHHVNKTYQLLGFKPIDGVLGSDILVKLKAVINYNNKTLKIKV